MNRFASIAAYAAPLAVATVSAAVLMSGNAIAETPTIDTTPFVSTLSRAEVRAEVLRGRSQPGSGGIEWAMQMNDQQPHNSSISRAEVRAEYIASRDMVQAVNAEDSGSSYLAKMRVRGTDPSTVVAGSR